MLALVLALGGMLSVATAQGPEFDLAKFKDTYVRDGASCSYRTSCGSSGRCLTGIRHS